MRLHRSCTIGLGLALSAAACSSDFATCFDRAQRDYRDAQRRWHRAVHQAVAARDSALGPLSEFNTELQLAMVARAEKRLGSLARRRPAELRTDGGIAELLTLASWSSADESELALRDPEYAELGERVATLRSRTDGHPDWPALRALFRSEVGASSSLTRAQAGLEQAGDRFLRAARSCRTRD